MLIVFLFTIIHGTNTFEKDNIFSLFVNKDSIINSHIIQEENNKYGETSYNLSKKVFYINHVENIKSETINNNSTFICDNSENCKCNIFLNFLNKFKKTDIFSIVINILNENLEIKKKEVKKTSLVFCGSNNEIINEEKEAFLNFLQNFIELLEFKNKEKYNKNIIFFLCKLLKKNRYFLNKIGDLLFNFIQEDNEKKFWQNFFKKNNEFLDNQKYYSLIEFTNYIYENSQEVDRKTINEVIYKKYQLAIYKILKDEKFPNDEKKDLIKNIVSICKNNEKNLLIHKKINEFAKNFI
jgi:hypothetical protein